MRDPLPTKPTRPESGDPFLMTDDRLWSYGDLYALSTVWETRIREWMHPHSTVALTGEARRPGTFLLLRSHNREALLLHLACAWIARIPVLPLDPAMPASRLKALTSALPWSGALVNEPDTATSIGLIHENPLLAAIGEILSWPTESEESTDIPPPDRLRTAPNAWWGALLTSGSSGPPKTVPHRRRSWIHAVENAQARTPMAPGESWLLPLPLHHAGGMNVLLRALLTGSAVRLPRKTDAAGLTETLGKYPEIRAASVVPTQLSRLLDEPALQIPSPFHGILVGGGPIRESLLQRSVKRGLPVIASYGMTETAGQIASRHHHPDPEPHTSNPSAPLVAGAEDQSRPVPGSHSPATPTLQIHSPHNMRILDKSGMPIRGAREGALQVRGPQLFEGYLDVDGQTVLRDRFDADGWFHTGDWARLYPGAQPGEQLLEILSRRTDLILTGGENVQPNRVERVLETLPELRGAVVVGIEDPEWGERVVALVVLDPAGTAVTEDEWNRAKDGYKSTAVRELVDSIRERIHDRLTPAERPKEILFVKQLPTIGPGKLDRQEAKAVAIRQLRFQSG